MSKYARCDASGIVLEIFEHDTLDPSATHIADIAAQFEPCPDNVEPNWIKSEDGTYAAPVVPTPPVIDPRILAKSINPVKFMMRFTSAERVALRAARAADPAIDDFMTLLDDPRLPEVELADPAVQEAIEYCLTVAKCADIPARMLALLGINN